MVFARRSVLRATTAALSFRAPVRQSGQALGRRFYASGKGHEEQKSSDLPWLLGSVGLGGPMIFYVAQSGPVKKSHGDAHGDHKEETEGKEEAEQPADREAAEEKPSTQDSGAQQKKDEEKGGQEIGEANKEDSGHDEPAASKPTGGPGSISAKQEGLSNTDSKNPHIDEPGQSEKGEGETETAKVKGTVKPERPQQ